MYHSHILKIDDTTEPKLKQMWDYPHLTGVDNF